MNITVKILDVSKEQWTKTAKGGYGSITVTFSGDKGEQSKKFQSFTADIYRQVKALEVGSTYEVRIEKEGDYWNWKEVTKVEGAAPDKKAEAPARTTSTGANWDERLKFDKEKQILIIRQSCLSSSVESFKAHDQPPAEAIIARAATFEDYVLNGYDGGVVEEDIPAEVEGAPRKGRPRKEPVVVE